MSVVDDFLRNWYVYASMPIIAAVIGYVTKVVAVRMMFRPLEFVGRRPFFGWQGVIPRRAARMASIAVDTMTGSLISQREVINRLDPERIAMELEAPMVEAIGDITREVAAEYQPGMWESLPESGRAMVIRRVQHEAPRITASVVRMIQEDVDRIFDLKDMVVTSLVRDKALLNRIFQEAGREEFKFIIRCGLPFGFLLGLIQMVTWALTKEPLIIPTFGLVTGWFTDWLALKMIFFPKRPRRFFGFEWQGLFLKRRKEVSEAYADLIATEIITPKNVIEAILRGPLSDRVFALVEREVQNGLDRQTGFAKPLVVLAVGSSRYQQMKHRVSELIMSRLPATMRHLEEYAAEAMDIRNTLVSKMDLLTDEQFEGLLRPAFQQDEWMLITVGAVLGFGVGELQVLLVEHLSH